MTNLQQAVIFLLLQQIPDLHGDLRDQAIAHMKAIEAEAESEDLDSGLVHDLAEVMAAGAESNARQPRAAKNRRRSRATSEAETPLAQNPTTEAAQENQ